MIRLNSSGEIMETLPLSLANLPVSRNALAMTHTLIAWVIVVASSKAFCFFQG